MSKLYRQIHYLGWVLDEDAGGWTIRLPDEQPWEFTVRVPALKLAKEWVDKNG